MKFWHSNLHQCVRLPVLLVLIFGIAVLGCDQTNSKYPLAPVTGKITLDGSPLTGAMIVFFPLPTEATIVVGPFSSGVTDLEGNFTLTTRYGDPGAVIGEHEIHIHYEDVDPYELSDAERAIMSSLENTHEEFPNELQASSAIVEGLSKRLAGRRPIPPEFAIESMLRFTVKPEDNLAAEFKLISPRDEPAGDAKTASPPVDLKSN